MSVTNPVAGIIDTRVLGKPNHFSGKELEFQDFKFQVIVYCGLLESELPPMMKILAQQAKEIRQQAEPPEEHVLVRRFADDD